MQTNRLSELLVLALLMVLMFGHSGWAEQDSRSMQVWKNPSCGCCGKWVAHMRAAGFNVTTIDTDAMAAIKSQHGVPEGLAACHTAKVGGYIIEGHVPAGDVLKLLQKKPPIVGISVPGMPMGSPGMEMPDGAVEAFDTIAFTKGGGSKVFSHHPASPPTTK